MWAWMAVAWANSTGEIRYETSRRADVDLPPGELVLRDDAGTAESPRVIEQVAMQLQGTGWTARPDASCERGAVGILALASLDVRTSRSSTQVMVTTRELNIAGSSASASSSATVWATRNGQALHVDDSGSASSIAVGFTDRVPAVEGTVRAVATARWTLEACDGRVVGDDLEEVELARRAVGATEEQAQAGLDDTALRTIDVPRALGTVHRSRYVARGRTVVRRYYDSGSAGMESGALALRRGQDWERAAEAWQDDAFATDARVRARALYNLALYHERAGDLSTALRYATESQQARAGDLASTLVDDLTARVRRSQAL